MRVLGDWVNEILARDGAAEGSRLAVGEALRSTDAGLRERAAELVVDAITRARPGARAELLHLLQTSYWPPTPGMSSRAFSATLPVLEGLTEDAPEAKDLPMLWANLSRANPDVALLVAEKLMDERPAVRRAAAGAVGRMGPTAREHLPALTQLLRDADPAVADTAMESLSALGPLDLDNSLLTFRSEVRSAQGRRRFLALSALRGLLEHAKISGIAISPDEAADEQALLEALNGSDEATRLQAVGLLGLSAATSPKAETTLKASLQDASPDVAAAAAIALLRLERGVDEAVRLLREQLVSGQTRTQDAAVYALEPLDVPVLARARPALENAAEKASGMAREAAIGLLLRLQRSMPSPNA